MTTHNIELHGAMHAGFAEIMTPDALEFVAALMRGFGSRREELLEARGRRRARRPTGRCPTSCRTRGTCATATGPWRPYPATCSAAASRSPARRPQDDDQRAELGRRRVHGGLRGRQRPDVAKHGRGAQINLRDAIDGTITYRDSDGNDYELDGQPGDAARAPARLASAREARPRRRPSPSRAPCSISGCTVPQRAALLARGSGPYFYLPKLESHLEARLWNDVFVFAQDALGIPARSRRRC